MEQYINKSDLVAEIKNIRKDYINSCMFEQADTLSNVLDFIDTLEAKEIQ